MTRAEVLSIVAELTSDDIESQSAAVSKLENLPIGYFEDHPLPRKKVAPFLPQLASLLKTTCSDSVKEWCAQLLGESGLRNDENLDALIAGLGSDRAGVLMSAIWAIGSYGQMAVPAIEKLFDLASHAEPQVRWRAVWALTEIAPSGIETAKRFADYFNDSERLVRGYAVIGFVKTAPASRWAIEQLEPFAKDNDDMPRLHAEEAIKRWQEKEREAVRVQEQ
jgi:HEAT repeat protein